MKKSTLSLLISVFTLTIAVNTATADVLQQYTVNGASFLSGGSLTGSFTYDVTTDALTAWNLTVSLEPAISNDDLLNHTYLNTSAYTYAQSYPNTPGAANPNELYSIFDSANTTTPFVYELDISTTGLLGTLGTQELARIDNATSGQAGASYGDNDDTYVYDRIISGTVTGVSAVPLPTSIITFVSGLLGLVALRRKATQA
jgi:hypothetical protein